jgi:peptidyl-prolyl cis-trans isomerase SurA
MAYSSAGIAVLECSQGILVIAKIMYKKITLLLTLGCFLYPMMGQSADKAQSTPMKTQPAEPKEQSLNRIAGVVNDEVIPESEVDDAVTAYKQELLVNKMALPPDDVIRKKILDQIIDYRLQLQLAARADVKPTDEDINNAIIQVAKSHNVTLDELKQQLAQQNVPWDSFRQKIAEQVTISKVQQQAVGPRVKVTDADVAEFKQKYQATQQAEMSYHLIDFVTPLPEQPTQAEVDKALAQAREISNQLNNGASIGGITPPYEDLGWRKKSDMPDLFLSQLDQLNPKNASVPLRAPNGYHVIKLVETKSGEAPTDAQIREYLYRVKLDK